MDKRGLSYAIDYLKAFKPIRLVPDAIYKRAGISGLVSSLGHSLRREARRPNPRVNVSYTPDESGKDIAYYTYNVDHDPNYKANEQAPEAPTYYFYTLKSTPVASPLFLSIEALKKDPNYSVGCKIWQGSHETPVLMENV